MSGWLLRLGVPVLLVLVAASLYLFSYPPPPVESSWELAAPDHIESDALTVRFSGTSTLLFSDGTTDWMIDGWFTRPSLVQSVLGAIEPDLDAITLGLQRNGVDQLAAVIPMHSHYDHAMDSPEVARRTGAMLYGSEATANIARGWGLDESQIRTVADREVISLGAFEITFIESRHFQFPDPEMVETMLTQSEISEPLQTPASMFDYKLGKAYVLSVRHPKGNFMVVGSAGYIPGLLEEFETEHLFLGVGGLGSQSADYRRQYWQETVQAVAPQQVILIHWDSLVGPLDGPLTGEVRIAGFLSQGADLTLAFLRVKSRDDKGPRLVTLPRFSEIALRSK